MKTEKEAKQTAEELADAMAKLKEDKVRLCTEHLANVLKQHQCRLVPITSIIGQEIRATIEVVPE